MHIEINFAKFAAKKRLLVWVKLQCLVDIGERGCKTLLLFFYSGTASVTQSKPGIGFDDVQWSDELGRVIVPAGRTGNVFLIDPDSLALTTDLWLKLAPSLLGGR